MLSTLLSKHQKALLVGLLSAASAVASESNDISKGVTEADRDNDGVVDVRMEKVYRGTNKVLVTMFRRNDNGKMTAVARVFLINGKNVMSESDEDGNGTMESVQITDPATGDFDEFKRQADGSIEPIATHTLSAIKMQKAVADESLRKLLTNPEMSDEEMVEILRENERRIKELEKEK